ncbi:MAG: phosphoglucosamine mutase [Vicinamibacterales bacterium]
MATTSKLFGTDGVRGVAGVFPLDPVTVARLGAALVRVLPKRDNVRLLVGRDTRESGPWLEQALAQGIASQGATLTSLGIVPTPAVAFLTRAEGFDAGLVISASHNPFADNGIKVFSGKGEKFDERLEGEIESTIAGDGWSVDTQRAVGLEVVDLSDRYLEHARHACPDPRGLRGARIAVDCGNGATTPVAPRLLRAMGFDVTAIGCEPDGRNINLDCGSTHPQRLADLVRQGRHKLGIAFDGDGDRAILVDANGSIVDGDAVMLMCAKHLKRTGRLKGPAVVATVMSNIGLELALKADGIDMVRCSVGDKYVMEEILKRDLSLGGEQSGHIIFSEFLFTGDGLVTALSVLNVMAETGRELADLAGELVTYPQVLVNVRVARKRDLTEEPSILAVMRRVEEQLVGRGRLLVRYSGTEPLLRIMLEGQDQDQIRIWAEEIAAAVRAALG